MSLPDQTPKLPKLPFLVADAALLGAAWLIADRTPGPLTVASVYAIVGCVVGAGLLGAIPFLTDYARRQDEALDDRQRGLEALSRTIASSAEQISIAAQGLHEIIEVAQKSLREAEQLPRRPEPADAGARDERAERLAGRLDAAVERLAKAAADLAKAEAAAQKRQAAAREEARAERPPPPPEKPPEPAARLPEPAPAPPPPPSSPPEPAPVAAASAPAAAPAPAPRPARKPKPPPPPEPPAAEQGEFSQIGPEEAAPASAVSADGATRLLVTAYIGIGNRLFVRGEGPGLSWDRGLPLQFVSIGKWRWETADAAAPVRYKLYKNDEIECAALGERTLEPGRQQEITAAF